jgi:hypothetical protein
MATTSFRILQRRSSTSGVTPQLCTLCDGELFVQLADETIYFRNNKNQLVCTFTDKNFENLCNVFAPTGNYVNASQTGVFALSANTGNFVTASQTGVFALSANTGNFVTASQTGCFLTRVGNATSVTSTNFGNNNCNLNSSYSFLGRGEFNSQSGVLCSFLGGGTTNTQRASGTNYCGCVSRSFLGAGWTNVQEDIQTSFLGAGRTNLQIGSVDSFIGAGEGNKQRNNNWSFIGAGESNCQSGNNRASTVGGRSNWILGTENSFIGGGCFNCMSGSFNSSILGGFGNRITGGQNVFILGCEIIANNACNTLFVNNLTSVNGVISGNGAGITGMTYNQTWQSVSRSISTNYVNNTSQPIAVNMLFNNCPAVNPAIGCIVVGAIKVAQFNFSNNSIVQTTLNAIVPTGADYCFYTNGGTISVVELR